MLEWERDRNGHSIPKWNGALLASRIDPKKEARQWVESHKHELSDVRHSFVLGGGAGFHIVELAKRFPEINFFVIELVQDLAVHITTLVGTLTNVTVFTPSSPLEFLKDLRVGAVLSERFAILRHRSSCRAAASSYAELSTHLTGRDPRSLHVHLSHRSSDLRFFEEIAFEALKTRGLAEAGHTALISINDILGAMESKNLNTDEAMLWRALGELVV